MIAAMLDDAAAVDETPGVVGVRSWLKPMRAFHAV